MMPEFTWLTKLILSHLLTDFVLQPRSWVDDRYKKHYGSSYLYLHGLVTGSLAWAMIGWDYWPVALLILVTHTLIDGWKSYQPPSVKYFLLDQLMHLLIIIACWYFSFFKWPDLLPVLKQVNASPRFWQTLTAIVFLTTPAGILIGQLTKKWRDSISGAESLADAGKWIGIVNA